MAEIYTQAGEELTVGLQGSGVCNEAMRAAKAIAKDRGESVRLEDDDDCWDVYPDGTVEEAEAWESIYDSLYDSETNDYLAAEDLEITNDEYEAACLESEQCRQPEGHIEISGRRVYAS